MLLLQTETAIALAMGHGLQYIKSLFMLPAHIVVLPSLRSQSFFTAVSSFHQVVLHHFYYFSLSKLDLCTIVLNSALRFPVKRRKMMVVFLKKMSLLVLVMHNSEQHN